MWGNLNSSGNATLYQKIVSSLQKMIKMSCCEGAADFWFTVQGWWNECDTNTISKHLIEGVNRTFSSKIIGDDNIFKLEISTYVIWTKQVSKISI